MVASVLRARPRSGSVATLDPGAATIAIKLPSRKNSHQPENCRSWPRPTCHRGHGDGNLIGGSLVTGDWRLLMVNPPRISNIVVRDACVAVKHVAHHINQTLALLGLGQPIFWKVADRLNDRL